MTVSWLVSFCVFTCLLVFLLKGTTLLERDTDEELLVIHVTLPLFNAVLASDTVRTEWPSSKVDSEFDALLTTPFVCEHHESVLEGRRWASVVWIEHNFG